MTGCGTIPSCVDAEYRRAVDVRRIERANLSEWVGGSRSVTRSCGASVSR